MTAQTDDPTLLAFVEARRAMADAAVAGPWTVADSQFVAQGSGGDVPDASQVICAYFDDETAAHIATNDPQTVTRMLDVIEAAERRRQAWVAMSTAFAAGDYAETGYDWRDEHEQALRDENAALDALTAHLRGEA